MKKVLSILLVSISLMFVLCGCGDEVKNTKETVKNSYNELLPFELKFGMTYDKAKETYKDFPELEGASTNNGYLTKENITLDYEDHKELFGIDLNDFYEEYDGIIIFDPECGFSFNESKKLYELYLGAKIANSESASKVLFDDYVKFYDKKLGKEAEMEDEFNAYWQTDTLNVGVHLEIENDYCFVYTTLHNKEFELSK